MDIFPISLNFTSYIRNKIAKIIFNYFYYFIIIFYAYKLFNREKHFIYIYIYLYMKNFYRILTNISVLNIQ